MEWVVVAAGFLMALGGLLAAISKPWSPDDEFWEDVDMKIMSDRLKNMDAHIKEFHNHQVALVENAKHREEVAAAMRAEVI